MTNRAPPLPRRSSSSRSPSPSSGLLITFKVVELVWMSLDVAECVKLDFGNIDVLVHSFANGPEVWIFHH
ncbi:hypothetical protein RHMOL_Rhmol11G0202200 [Rhododendron molle]|uniref:Uncharacterized protein n=1 Tax=Rhododendron molle TaxID=49168 RepID=A0ACC0LV99_RHOML|nr:hypothetical protein RHMOL_Rhmol11G0202200 [Rhododendron molle]